jgi:peptidoglycan/LPS O-acetylase OafA/YrhL
MYTAAQCINQSRRFEYLDGLRGIAAVAVAIFHFLCAFGPAMLPGIGVSAWRGSDTPLAIIYNGNFAVAIFFVMSGFVISQSASKRATPLAFNLAQRYVRLASPALISTLLAYLLLWVFADTVHYLRWSGHSRWLTFVHEAPLPDLVSAIKSGLYDVFRHGDSNFNNVLWTMKIELIGSCALYVVYAAKGYRLCIAGLLAGLFATMAIGKFEYASFFAGALMREAVSAEKMPCALPIAALITGIILGSMMKGWDHRVLGDLLPGAIADDRGLALGEPHAFWHLVGSILIIYALLNIPTLQKWLSNKVFRYLGRISFGFYLVHVPIIYTVAGSMFVVGGTSIPWLLLTFYVFMSISLVLGHLFTLAVDQPITEAIKWTRTKLVVPRKLHPSGSLRSPASGVAPS